MLSALAKARDGALTKLADVLGETSDVDVDDEDNETVASDASSTGDAWLADEDDDILHGAPSPASQLLAAAAAGAHHHRVLSLDTGFPEAFAVPSRPPQEGHANGRFTSQAGGGASTVPASSVAGSAGVAPPAPAARALFDTAAAPAALPVAEPTPNASAASSLDRTASGTGLVDIPLSPGVATAAAVAPQQAAARDEQLRVKLAAAVEDTSRLRDALAKAQRERDDAIQAREEDAARAARSAQASGGNTAVSAEYVNALQRRVEAAEAAAAAAQATAAEREASADAARGAAEDAAAAAAEALDAALHRASAAEAESIRAGKELARLRAHLLEMEDADACAADEARSRLAAEMASLRSERDRLRDALEERESETRNLQAALGAMSAEVEAQHRRMAEAAALSERLGIAAAEVATARAQAEEARRQAEIAQQAASAAERNAQQRSDEAQSLAAEASRLRGMLETALKRLSALSAAQAASCDKHAVAALVLAYVAAPHEQQHAEQLAATLGMDVTQRASMGLDGAPAPALALAAAAALSGRVIARHGLGRLLGRGVTHSAPLKQNGHVGDGQQNGDTSLADAWFDFLRAQAVGGDEEGVQRSAEDDHMPASPAVEREARIAHARQSVGPSQDAPPSVRAEPPQPLSALIGDGPRVL